VARTVTLANLRTWARQLSDTEGDTSNITDAELTALANRHLTEVYDALVDAGPADYYASSQTVNVVAGTIAYALPADFRDLLEVYVHESDSERRILRPMGNGERGRYQAPLAATTLTVEYVPAPGTLVANGDTFDGVSGWEELIANLMARDVMVKREADPSVVLHTIAELRGRIARRARMRDRANPKRITDLDEQSSLWFPTASSNVSAYRLRGGNLEVYESLWRVP